MMWRSLTVSWALLMSLALWEMEARCAADLPKEAEQSVTVYEQAIEGLRSAAAKQDFGERW